MKSYLFTSLKTLVLAGIILLGVGFASAQYNPPPGPPVDGNPEPFIDVSINPQAKRGALKIGGTGGQTPNSILDVIGTSVMDALVVFGPAEVEDTLVVGTINASSPSGFQQQVYDLNVSLGVHGDTQVSSLSGMGIIPVCADTNGVLIPCEIPDIDPTQGCTDPTATNYDPAATEDDGSCDYGCPDVPVQSCNVSNQSTACAGFEGFTGTCVLDGGGSISGECVFTPTNPLCSGTCEEPQNAPSSCTSNSDCSVSGGFEGECNGYEPGSPGEPGIPAVWGYDGGCDTFPSDGVLDAVADATCLSNQSPLSCDSATGCKWIGGRTYQELVPETPGIPAVPESAGSCEYYSVEGACATACPSYPGAIECTDHAECNEYAGWTGLCLGGSESCSTSIDTSSSSNAEVPLIAEIDMIDRDGGVGWSMIIDPDITGGCSLNSDCSPWTASCDGEIQQCVVSGQLVTNTVTACTSTPSSCSFTLTNASCELDGSQCIGTYITSSNTGMCEGIEGNRFDGQYTVGYFAGSYGSLEGQECNVASQSQCASWPGHGCVWDATIENNTYASCTPFNQSQCNSTSGCAWLNDAI